LSHSAANRDKLTEIIPEEPLKIREQQSHEKTSEDSYITCSMGLLSSWCGG